MGKNHASQYANFGSLRHLLNIPIYISVHLFYLRETIVPVA